MSAWSVSSALDDVGASFERLLKKRIGGVLPAGATAIPWPDLSPALSPHGAAL